MWMQYTHSIIGVSKGKISNICPFGEWSHKYLNPAQSNAVFLSREGIPKKSNKGRRLIFGSQFQRLGPLFLFSSDCVFFTYACLIFLKI